MVAVDLLLPGAPANTPCVLRAPYTSRFFVPAVPSEQAARVWPGSKMLGRRDVTEHVLRDLKRLAPSRRRSGLPFRCKQIAGVAPAWTERRRIRDDPDLVHERLEDAGRVISKVLPQDIHLAIGAHRHRR